MARSRYQMTAEKMEKREDQRGGFYDSIFKPEYQVYKVRKGINTVRFLTMFGEKPHWQTDEHFGMDVWLHRNVGPDNGTYLCLRKHKNEPCPVCEERQELDAAGSSEAAKEIVAKKSVVYWLVDRDDEDKGPQLHMWGYTLDQDLAQRCKDRQTGKVIDILDEEEGYDVSFRRGEEKPYPKTSGIEIARRDSPICDDQRLQDKWVRYVEDNPLDENILNYFDYDYIHNILHARGSRKREDDDDRGSRRSRDPDDDSPQRSRRDPPDDDRPPRRSRDRDDDRDDDRGRSRDRGRDEDPPPRRSRERDDDDRGRDRGRDRDREDDDDRDGRDRSRRDEPEEPRRRTREHLPDDEPPNGKDPDPTDQARESLRRMRDGQDDRNPPRRGSRGDDRNDDPPRRSRDRDRDEDPPPRRSRDREEEPPPRSRRPT